MVPTTSKSIAFILLLAFVASSATVKVQYSYAANQLKFYINGREFQSTYTNAFYRVPKRLTLYYLDACDAKKVDAKTIDSLVASKSYDRPQSEIEREVAADDANEKRKYEEEVARKKKEEETGQEQEAPKEPERKPDPPVSGSFDIFLANAKQEDVANLVIEMMGVRFDEAMAVMSCQSAFQSIIVQQDKPSSDPRITTNYDSIYLTETQSTAYMSARYKPALVTNPDDNVVFLSSGWTNPNDFVGFMFFARPSGYGNIKPKMFVENGRLTVYIYSTNPFFRLRHKYAKNSVNVKIEMMNMNMAVFDYVPQSHLKNVRLSLRNPNEPAELVYSGPITTEKDFDGNRDIPNKIVNRFSGMSNARWILSRGRDSVDLELLMKSSSITEFLMAKVIQEFGVTRLSLFYKDGFGNRRKFITSIAHRGTKPINIMWLAAGAKKSYKLEFEKKILVDPTLFREHHYNEFLASDDVFTKDSIAVKAAQKGQTFTDFAWVTNFESNQETLRSMQIVVHEQPSAILVVLYDRDKGVVTKVEPTTTTFYSLFRSADKYRVDLPVTTPQLQIRNELKLDFKIYDVGNKMQEFDFKSFSLLKNELYFVAFDTYFSLQLTNIKVEVCKNGPDQINFCGFSSGHQLEVDQYKDKVVYWQLYYPTTLDLPRKAFGYNVEFVLVSSSACTAYAKSTVDAYRLTDATKYWVNMPFKMVNEKLTTVHCDAAVKTCYVLFSQTGSPKATEETLPTFTFTGGAKPTCSIKLRGSVNGSIQKGQMALTASGSGSGIAFKFLDETGLDYKKFRYVSWGETQSSTLNCQPNSKNKEICDENYFFWKDEMGVLTDSILSKPQTILTAPLLLAKRDGFQLIFTPYFTEGEITILLMNNGLYIGNADSEIARFEFSAVKAYQKAGGHYQATLRLFLLNTVPISVPVSLSSYLNVQSSIDSKQEWDVKLTTRGNVDPMFTYVLWEQLQGATFSVYYVEDKDGKLEILVYNDKALGILESVDQKTRAPVADFRELTVGNKNDQVGKLIYKMEWPKRKPEEDLLSCGDRLFGYFHVETAWRNAVVVVVPKPMTVSADPSSYDLCWFSTGRSQRAPTGIIEQSSKFFEENPEDLFRVI